MTMILWGFLIFGLLAAIITTGFLSVFYLGVELPINYHFFFTTLFFGVNPLD
ncbi:hypothetical protein [Cytobacillus oceanisediminis]|uniref:hypothetical protein n=1 Tax=Cytobacillus oceanisediminis TaxID=665099 RepID=UPI001587D337|nr:hypothetical protein [Cytobacillus oceanisediminis]